MALLLPVLLALASLVPGAVAATAATPSEFRAEVGSVSAAVSTALAATSNQYAFEQSVRGVFAAHGYVEAPLANLSTALRAAPSYYVAADAVVMVQRLGGDSACIGRLAIRTDRSAVDPESSCGPLSVAARQAAVETSSQLGAALSQRAAEILSAEPDAPFSDVVLRAAADAKVLPARVKVPRKWGPGKGVVRSRGTTLRVTADGLTARFVVPVAVLGTPHRCSFTVTVFPVEKRVSASAATCHA